MGGYSDSLSANMESSRNCLRKIARHNDTEFSKDSILNAMEKFVKTVNTMEETVLVPCRLMDLKIESEEKPVGPGRRRDVLASEDLFALYNMLNAAKMELLWGRDVGEELKEPVPQKKGHVRRPSTASTASTSSGTSLPSDTDSEAGAEGSEDSGVEGEEPEVKGAQKTAADFKRHLMGLRRSLAGLTEAATSLTQRYQADVGAPV